MLQIRLSKGGGSSGGAVGAPGGKSSSAVAVDTVTVACPDHLVLADLPVGKSLGAVTASAFVRSVGRRSRRHLGERVHFCVRCDFPIAIYGRLVPCEHAFCLACARTDPSCYLCDERIQKIQTIKLMEGIYICAAPHCLKSFLKKADFEAHINEIHSDLLRSNIEEEESNENSAFNATRPSSTDAQKQSQQPEVSTARAPPRPGFSPSSNSQQQDREERTRRHQSREPPPRPPLQKPPSFQSRHQPHSGDVQAENTSHGFDRPQNWFPQPPNGPPYHQNPDQSSSDKPTNIPPEASYHNFPPLPQQPLNYQLPLNANQMPFPYVTFPTDGSQPFYTLPPEMQRPDSLVDNGSQQGSVLAVPQPPTGVGSQWGMGFVGVPFQPTLQMGQVIPEGFANPINPQAGVAFFQGEFSHLPEGFTMNPPLPSKEPEQPGGNEGKGLMPSQLPSLTPPMPLPPPPPMPPPISQQQQQQYNRSRDIPPGFGWPNDKRGPD